MGRPTNADSAKTFERIRSAALALLEREGMTAVSVRRVAKEAGVGMGTLRYYFPTREDLLEACLDGYHERFVALEEQMVAHFRTSSDPRAAAATAVRASFATIALQPALQRLRLVTSIQQGELPEHRRTQWRSPFVRNAADTLASQSDDPVSEMPLVVDTVMRLVSWYTACSDDELRDITGESSAEIARDAIREHVVRVALRLVFGTSADRTDG